MYKKIASNTFSQIVSKILTALISIVLIGILTKTLPLELYGSYNKVFSYVGIFAFLADLGLYTIAIREISLHPHQKAKIIGNVLTLRLTLGVLIWIIAFLMALFLPGYNDFYTLSAIGIIGAFTLISLINSALLALMQSQMKIEFSLISLVSGKLINLALVAYFLLFAFEKIPGSYLAFMSIFIAATIGVFCTSVLNYWYARKICPISFACDTAYIQHIFKISFPYGIALFLSVVYFKIDILILSFIESPEQADISIALYGLPMKIVEVLMVLGGFYLNSLLPSLSEYYKEKNIQKLKKVFGISLKFLGSLGVLICLLGVLLKKEIIGIIATPEYINPSFSAYSSVDVLASVFFVLLFHFLALCCIYILIASRNQGMLLKINIFVTCINIIGNIILIPYLSFFGAALVTLLSQIVLLCLSGYYVGKIIGIPWKYLGELLKSMLIALLLYLSFFHYFEISALGDILKILIFGGAITGLYIFFEYIFSRKLIKELRSG